MKLLAGTTTILLIGWGAVGFSQPILGGFVEGVQAFRVDRNETLGDDGFLDRSYPRSEMRLQLTGRLDEERTGFFVRTDVVGDGREVQSGYQGQRFNIHLREAYIKIHLKEWFDIKAGRQVATWGTGDLIFVNDLFPKDWEAFFTALDDSYLKSPLNMLRASLYSNGLSLELALSPYFTPDNLPSGTRMTLFDPDDGRTTIARVIQLRTREPSKILHHGEIAARLGAVAGSAEWSLYGYAGYWPTPQGVSDSYLWYPLLRVLGASLRLPLGAFLTHAEVAYYDSPEDPGGDDPQIANSQVRGFAGTERSLGRGWTVGTQYYAEWMMDYDENAADLPAGAPSFDEVRSTITLRVTKLARHQTVQLSVFGFWGISDKDWHLRPSVSYDVTDAVNWTVGGSLLDGEKPYTTFGQFRGNSNAFTRLRYSF